ncbi:MAG: gamma-glutamyltransferase family protein [Proteobacteria bacterium]|nr:gamma-glutamyltransferase family protein [Pseudomonadota bacterium]
MSGSNGDYVSRRSALIGTRHMVAAGHVLAAEAAHQVLEAGGNAVDAAVAGGLVLGVVQSEFVNVAGVAPILIHIAGTGESVTIDGLGVWPRAASAEFFRQTYGGDIPRGIHRVVVPAAPDAWLTALERFGSMGFAEVAASAIRFAREGFVMYPLMAHLIEKNAAHYAEWPASAAIYLPGGRAPKVGEVFVQADLARTLQYMADEEKAAAAKGREAGIGAARDAFYKGDIAAAIVRYHRENGGFLTAEDMAGYRVSVEPPVATRFRDYEVLTCGPWCQGPAFAHALRLLDGFDLARMGHNSPAYAHTLIEAFKLVFADRERHYGDPRFVDVPLEGLLSPEYATARRALIRPFTAWSEMPPAGDPRLTAPVSAAGGGRLRAAGGAFDLADTSYICVVDRLGNAVSATPSDNSWSQPVVPGTGLSPSGRGSQSRTDPAHPCCLAPGKRPRLTPNPAMVMKGGRPFMPIGSPGGDVQVQAMVQAFLNVAAFGMDPQVAVDAPRFATFSFPNSFAPHAYLPGRANLEGRIAPEVGSRLAALGNDVEWWPEATYLAGAVCAIVVDRDRGTLAGAADFRRHTGVAGW